MRLFGADVSTSTEPQAAAALVTMDRHKETIESRFQVPVRTNVWNHIADRRASLAAD